MTIIAALIMPFIGIMIGSLLGLYLAPSLTVLIYLRYFTIGVLFAATVTELTPEVANAQGIRNRLFVLLGIFLGASTLLTLRYILDKFPLQENKFPIETIVIILVDCLVDSFFIGIATQLSDSSMIILVIALSFQLMVVLFTLTDQLKTLDFKLLTIIFIVIIITVIIFCGIYGGYRLGKRFNGNKSLYYLIFAFALAFIIWSIIVELIVTNSNAVNIVFAGIALFIGFIFITVLRWLLPARFKCFS